MDSFPWSCCPRQESRCKSKPGLALKSYQERTVTRAQGMWTYLLPLARPPCLCGPFLKNELMLRPDFNLLKCDFLPCSWVSWSQRRNYSSKMPWSSQAVARGYDLSWDAFLFSKFVPALLWGCGSMLMLWKGSDSQHSGGTSSHALRIWWLYQ